MVTSRSAQMPQNSIRGSSLRANSRSMNSETSAEMLRFRLRLRIRAFRFTLVSTESVNLVFMPGV